MALVAHISDLHFGSVNSALAEALAGELRDQAPDVLVVSGDLTQRARRRQYAEAARYLARLPQPQIVVPGNHDIPLYNVVRRFRFPLSRYRQHITADLFPFHCDGSVAVLGINTARSWTWSWKGFWRDGRISIEQLLEVERRFRSVPGDVFKVLVTHHPFIPPPRRRLHGVVGGVSESLQVLKRCGVDLVLAGHLHTVYSGDVRAHYQAAATSILSVQAGSAISTRLRREPNAYNLIRIESNHVALSVRTWNGSRFVETFATDFRKVDRIWQERPAMSAAVSPLGPEP